jgi:pimeloyl-ACP methyl ester carboxylesterase
MAFFEHDGLRFHYLDEGQGIAFIFQHGLGGDTQQPFDLLKAHEGFRLLALDCRAHGQTTPVGDPNKITFSTFAEDVLALMDHLRLRQVVIGGISMGAGVALNLASRFPERVLALVLSRPAWLDQPLPPNARIFPFIADLIRTRGARGGLTAFRESAEYKRMLISWPDTATSLLGQFEQPRAEETVEKLVRIPNDVPSHDSKGWARISVPTLILANRQDPIHPFEYGEALARVIPGSTFKELTSKSINKERHLEEVQRFIGEFLQRHFANPKIIPC